MTLAELMPLERAFHERTGKIYYSMVKRFKVRLWKSGRKAGRVRQAGREVPFTVDEFRAWVLDKLGGKASGCGLCVYCKRPITAEDLTVEHAMPITRGGELGFSNLDISCADCNRAKGQLTASEFLEVKNALDLLVQRGVLHPVSYQNIWQRMKGQATIYRKRREEDKAKVKHVPVTSSQLTIEDAAF